MDALRAPSTQDKRKTITISFGGQVGSTNPPGFDPSIDMTKIQEATTAQELDQLVNTSPNLILDCYAPWCNPCKKIAPVFEEYAQTYNATNPNVVFAKCNIEDVGEVSDLYGVTKFPTFLIFKNGKVIDSILGTQTPFHEMTFMYFKKPGQSQQDLQQQSKLTTDTPTPAAATPILASPVPALYVAPRAATTPTEEAQIIRNPRLIQGSSRLNLPPRPQDLVDLINSLSPYHLVFFYSSKSTGELPSIYSPSRLQPFGFNDSGSSGKKVVGYDDIIGDLTGVCQKTKTTSKPVSFTAIDVDEQPSLATEFNVNEKTGPVVKLFYKKIPFFTFEKCANAKTVEAKFSEFLAL